MRKSVAAVTGAAGGIGWTADPSRAVLLIHDLQNHFADAFARDVPPIPELVTNIIALRSHCATLGIPVVYGDFQQTPLARVMADLGRDQLIITGIYAHLGCLMTAREAFMRDIEVFFVADATADLSADHHLSATTYAAGRCTMALTTDRVLSMLPLAPPPAGRPVAAG
ncbi:isochorismatase family protein [Actinomadura craniellae]|nr:isochorismatase family protein [Actinomadura craniellae]